VQHASLRSAAGVLLRLVVIDPGRRGLLRQGGGDGLSMLTEGYASIAPATSHKGVAQHITSAGVCEITKSMMSSGLTPPRVRCSSRPSDHPAYAWGFSKGGNPMTRRLSALLLASVVHSRLPQAWRARIVPTETRPDLRRRQQQRQRAAKAEAATPATTIQDAPPIAPPRPPHRTTVATIAQRRHRRHAMAQRGSASRGACKSGPLGKAQMDGLGHTVLGPVKCSVDVGGNP
jgi:hypothetical protein